MEPIKEITEHLLKYVLPDNSTAEEREANPIAAQEVVDAIKGGKSIEIKNAVIEGDLTLESLAIDGKITIHGGKIRGRLDCSYAEFKQVLDFHSTTFQSEVKFTGAKAAKDIVLQRTIFHEKAEFTDMTVEGALYGECCEFFNEADFVSAQIGHRVVFTKGVFRQKAMFTGFSIIGTAFFGSTTFQKEANFGSAQINGRAIFQGATFKDDFDFASGRIGACAEFKDALFKKDAVFHRTRIEESAFFQNANFEGDVDFGYIRIGSNAEFNGAIFHKSAIFNSAIVEGHTLFNLDSSTGSQNDEQVLPKPTIFKGEADFASAVFLGGATFLGARFFENVDFFASRINMNAGFTDVVFFKNVSFLNASFGTLFFGISQDDVDNQFKGKIDLRGCAYDRIEPISIWEELTNKLNPYDRQPFTQLEETFRRAGEDDLANRVYYKRKRVESSRIKLRRPDAWILDQFLWLLTGYGVKLWRLGIALVIVLLFGTLIFHTNGAVEPKQCLTYPEAIWVSLNQFLPVAIPSGSEWKPSSEVLWGIIKFSSLATILKLLGWILVPVGVAGLSGWLKR